MYQYLKVGHFTTRTSIFTSFALTKVICINFLLESQTKSTINLNTTQLIRLKTKKRLKNTMVQSLKTQQVIISHEHKITVSSTQDEQSITVF